MANTDNTLDEVKSNGENPELAKLEVKTDEVLSPKPEEPKPDAPIEQPAKGFTESGYFFVKIHSSFGYLTILGYLQEAADFLKWHINMQRQAEEKKKIIDPAKAKGWGGRFNLFKGK